ncbi:hypothetical protein EC957_002501 [Mortierella hygrophila]|uniref:GH16 domain-containing protein n=1 Tax=Mortierella hygrophila TaxID=979708 RepID=A0A9P6F3G5_9FUNG|nr:hypothetical protein EC957_002501 [Mortierella hygrophila]
MKISPHRLSKPRGTILLALGVVVILSITTSTALAKSTTPADKHQQQHQLNEAQGQQTQQQQQQQHHEGGHVDVNGEFGLGDHSSFHAALDTSSYTGGEQLHKMIGVDYKPEGAARIEYGQQQQQQQTDFMIRDGENTERDEEMRGASAGIADRCLVFSDEFDKLDNSVWRHDITLTGGGNFEVQAYLNNRTNTFVRDGIFYIRPTLTEYRIGADALYNGGKMDVWGSDPGTQCTGNYDYGCFRIAGAGGNILNPVQSGLVRSVNSFKFRFGKVEIRAKMPKGKWIWPAIWMLPAHYQYGNWPASGEIDLVESRGNGPEYPGGGYDKVASTLHWGPSYEFNRFQMTHAEYALPAGKTFADDFHIFTLDWTPQGIKTFVDGNVLLDVPFNNMFEKGQFPPWVENLWENSNAAPFDQEFYLIMNVAVAGTAGYFPDGVGGKPWSDTSPHAINEFYAAKGDWYPTWGPEDGLDRAMAVDYVRIYKNDCQ